jgi:hypothetical protein
MDVFALDFDGVLCDSVAEAAVTAWRGGGKLWPHWQGEEPADRCRLRSEWQNATWHFVEDRLATLLRVAARDSLRRVRLYLAGWGYNTVADQVAVRQHPAITLWRAEQFLVV